MLSFKKEKNLKHDNNKVYIFLLFKYNIKIIFPKTLKIIEKMFVKEIILIVYSILII